MYMYGEFTRLLPAGDKVELLVSVHLHTFHALAADCTLNAHADGRCCGTCIVLSVQGDVLQHMLHMCMITLALFFVVWSQ